MNEKIRKSLALLIAAGMLLSAAPQVLAENEDELTKPEEVVNMTDEEAAVGEDGIPMTEAEKAAAEDDAIFEGTAETYEKVDTGMIVDLNFDDLAEGDYKSTDVSTVNYGNFPEKALSMMVEDGKDVGRDGKVLHMHQSSGATNDKVAIVSGISLANYNYEARTIVVGFDAMTKTDDQGKPFEMTLAGGNSGANVTAGFKFDKGTISLFEDDTSKGYLNAVKTTETYKAGEWHKLLFMVEVNEIQEAVRTTYAIDGKVIGSAVGTMWDEKGKAPSVLRMVLNNALSDVDIYLDNLTIVDLNARADYMAKLFGEDDNMYISDYVLSNESSIELPLSYNGADLKWSSSDTSVIDTDNMDEDGRAPVKHSDTDKDVKLSVSAAVTGIYDLKYPDSIVVTGSDKKEFNVTVQNSNGAETDASKANRIAKELIRSLKQQGTIVDADFDLPSTTTVVESGATITWSSNDTEHITVDGFKAKVTRPGFDASNAEVVMKASVTYATGKAEATVPVTVIRNDTPVTDEEFIRYAEATLGSLGFNEDLPRITSSDMSFPTSFDRATIKWESGDTEWLSNDGKIVQRPLKGTGTYDVVVKATVTAGSQSKTFSYVISIKPVEDAKAFPGAQGYGSQTRGGAGGYVYHVTTLAPDGEGSFKYGVETLTGDRIIVFDVGGTIDLTSVGRALRLSGKGGSHVTIAGQTAPGDGIQLKGYGLNLASVEDVIVRNIKIRIGNVRKAGDTYQSDPMSVTGSNKRVVLDHISMNWNVDMGFRVYGTEMTMSNCMITKAMYFNTPHEKGKHNYAGMFGPKYGTFYNNYIADMGQRAPRIIDNEYVDARNNVIYNCDRSFDICNYEWMGANTKFNIVANAAIKGNPNVSKRVGGSFKYFQGRTYSGGVFSYTANNTDTSTGSRATVNDPVEGAIWTADMSTTEKVANASQELAVINQNEYTYIATEYRDILFPDDMSLTDYNQTPLSKEGNTLMNYPFPYAEVYTRSPKDAVKYVMQHAGAIYPVEHRTDEEGNDDIVYRGNDTLNRRYMAEGRTRLKIQSDYSPCSGKQGIRLTDADIAQLKDENTAYGLPIETHTIYTDKNGAMFYDVDGKNVTDTDGLTVTDTYKFVTNPYIDADTLYVQDFDDAHKYRVILRDFTEEDDIFDAFNIYDINGDELVKPANYATVGETTVSTEEEELTSVSVGVEYTLNGSPVLLHFTELGDGPGNYAHVSTGDDAYADPSYVDTEWSDTDWPQLETVYRDSKEDKAEHPEFYKTGSFDSNRDGIPDYYVRLRGWESYGDKDISRYDFDGNGYTNIEEYINDWLCGDVETVLGNENDPVDAENVRDGSPKFNTHRSHQILFNTARRAKAQVYYNEGTTVDLTKAEVINLNSCYDVNDPSYMDAKDFNTYFDVLFPNVTKLEYTGEQQSLKPNTTYAYRIKLYSDSGVESISDEYTFTTDSIDNTVPGAPRITKYIPFDNMITILFEPTSPLRTYTQQQATGINADPIGKAGVAAKLVTQIGTPQYDGNIDHYVLRYSKNADMSDAKTINITGNASFYEMRDVENGTDYYIDLRAVNNAGQESPSAIYNFKQMETFADELDKDGNPTYGVSGMQVVDSNDVPITNANYLQRTGNKVHEYYYDDTFCTHAIQPSKYVVAVDYEKAMQEGNISEGETARFITYFGDVKDWYIYTLGGIPIPTKNALSDNKLMLMLRDDSHEHGFTYAKKFDTPLDKKLTVHARLKIVGEELDPMNEAPELRFYLQEDTAREDMEADTDYARDAGSFGTIMSLTFIKNEIKYGGKKIARYSDNEWYDIKILADSEDKTCSIYINDQLIQSDLEYSNHDSDGKTSVERWQISSRLAGKEDVYVDYMYAYNGWDDMSSGSNVEEGKSGAKPTGKGSGGGGGGGGGSSSSSDDKDVIIRNGDFNESPKVDNSSDEPEQTAAPSYINSQFNDMGAYSWAVPAVNALYEKGVVAGVGNNCFAPERPVTRAEFITMLMRGYELVGDKATCNFTDVKDGDWCYDPIAMAASMGVVNGRSDGSFGVNDKISRQDMSVMCVRLARAIGIELPGRNDSAEFTDKADISDYAAESVDALCKAGIVNGVGDGRFDPFGEANRAQAAKVIYEMITIDL